MSLRELFLIAALLVSLPVCFVNPFFGILWWEVIAFLNPQAYTWNPSAFPWALAVAVATLAGFALFCRGWGARLASGKVLLIVILWVWFTVTSIVATGTPAFFHHAADTWSRWWFESKMLLMTLVIIAVVDSLARLRILLLVMAGCFGLFVAKSVPFIIANGGKYRLFGPPGSMIADNNDFGLALNMTLPLFFALAQTETARWVKRLFAGLFIATIPTIFFTYSRGAMVALAVVLLLMMLASKRGVLLIPVLFFGGVMALAFAPQSWKDRMNPNQKLDASAEERLNAWAFARNLAADYPITGGGFATFTPELFIRYAPNGYDVKAPHSVYFGLLAEQGYTGLALYLFMVGVALWTTVKVARRARYFEDQTILTYAVALRFSILGFLANGVTLGRQYFDYFFSIVACVIILERVARQRWASMIESDPEEEETGSVPVEGVALEG